MILTRTFCITGLCLAWALALPSHAEKIYRWVDEQGVTHYTQQPPKNQTFDALYTPQFNNVNPNRAPEPSAKQTLSNKDSSPEPSEIRAAYCEQAKANLTTLNERSTPHVEEEGTKRPLTTEEIEAYKTESQKQVELYCQN